MKLYIRQLITSGYDNTALLKSGKMFILYVFECMFLLFLEGGSPGGSGLTLITTKQSMTLNDVMVGYWGWVVLALLVFGILLFLKYLRNRDMLKKYKKEYEEKGRTYKRKVFTKEDIKTGVILFVVSLVVLIIGILISIFAKDGSTFYFIGVIVLDIGIITTTTSVLAPLFKYLWRKFDV